MGVGYQVSALHLATRFDDVPLSKLSVGGSTYVGSLLRERALDRSLGTKSLRMMSPPKRLITEWRSRLEEKYRDQISAGIEWDEDSEFVVSEEVGISDESIFKFIVASLCLFDNDATKLQFELNKTTAIERHSIINAAVTKGLSGRFPQLLLGVTYWLPISEHAILEEPDWYGNKCRFGSTRILLDELAGVRASIRTCDPDIESKHGEPGPGRNGLDIAWSVSAVILDLCICAISRNLPLWTTP